MLRIFDVRAEHAPPPRPDGERKIDAVRRIGEQLGALDAAQAERVADIVERMIGGAA